MTDRCKRDAEIKKMVQVYLDMNYNRKEAFAIVGKKFYLSETRIRDIIYRKEGQKARREEAGESNAPLIPLFIQRGGDQKGNKS